MTLTFALARDLGDAARAFVADALGRSFRLRRIEFAPGELRLEIDEDITAEQIEEVVRNVLYVSKSISRKVVFENPAAHAYRDSPMAALQASGDVIRTADGMFSFQGTFWRVLKALQRYVLGVA